MGDITNTRNARCIDFNFHGEDDPVDYFSFTLTEPKKVETGLRQQDADATCTWKTRATISWAAVRIQTRPTKP